MAEHPEDFQQQDSPQEPPKRSEFLDYSDLPEEEEKGERRGLQMVHVRSALGITVVVAGIIVIALGTFLFEVLNGLPTLEELENPRPDLATRIFSADGVELDQFFVHNRRYVPFDSIAPAFFNALIATEDRDFYEHWGVSLERILKALFKNMKRGDLTREGASTITQQLARNLYLTREATIKRKLREQFTAIQIEKTYTKREILELYANTVYFGAGAYGVQVASEIFFNKSPLELEAHDEVVLELPCEVLAGPQQRVFVLDDLCVVRWSNTDHADRVGLVRDLDQRGRLDRRRREFNRIVLLQPIDQLFVPREPRQRAVGDDDIARELLGRVLHHVEEPAHDADDDDEHRGAKPDRRGRKQRREFTAEVLRDEQELVHGDVLNHRDTEATEAGAEIL